MAALTALGLNPGAAWAPGQYVPLGNGTEVYWDGAAFAAGRVPVPSTAVTAGAPGSFDNSTPKDLAALNALGIGSGAVWTVGQYVNLLDGSEAYWDGATFVSGRKPAVPTTGVTAGAPGSFTGDTPTNVNILNSLNLGSGLAWTAGQYVPLGNNTDARWNGATFVIGRNPVPSTRATAGAPGSFDKDVPNDLAALNTLGIGTGPAWGAGQHVLLGDGSQVRWTGSTFASGTQPVAATAVTAGAPGSFTGDVPATLAALNTLGIGSGSPWTAGQHVMLTDGSQARWNGAAFVAGAQPVASTSATAGAPGSFDKDVPADLAALNALNVGTGAAWAAGQHVVLVDGTQARWTGSTFAAGTQPVAATAVTAGTPGSFTGDVPATLAALAGLGIGTGPVWATGEYVTTTDGTDVHWDGAAFAAGRTPAGAGAPINSAAPTVSADAVGLGKVGAVHTVTNGTWTNTPTSYTYVWKRDGVAIAGATAAAYTTTKDDGGTTLTVEVTAVNASGSSLPMAATAIPVLYNAPTITTAIADQTLTTTDTAVAIQLPSSFAVLGDSTLESVSWSVSGDGVFETGVFVNVPPLVFLDGATPAGVTIAGAPPVLTIDPATVGVFSGTLYIKAENSSGASVTDDFTLDVTATAAAADWVLTGGAWDDTKHWDDTEVWEDA